MRAFLGLVATFFWCVAVFFVTLWLTFPSDAISDRIRYEVPLRLGGDYSAEVGSVGPWWLGVSVGDFKLHRAQQVEGVEQATLVAMLDGVRAAVSPFSLVRGSPYLTGRVDTVDGSMSYEVGTGNTGKNGIGVTDLVLWSEQIAVGDVLAWMPEAPATVEGAVAVDVDLRAGDEGGMKAATGHVKLTGADLSLSDIEIPGMGPLGMTIPISQLEINADVKDGRALIKDGHVSSPFANIEIKGEVALRDPMDRSSIDLEIVVSNLGDELAAFEGALASAKGSDGSYHYHCRGVVSRLNERSCSAGEDRRSATKPRSTRSTVVGADGGAPPATTTVGEDGETVTAPREPMDDEERAKRREEIRERLRQKREERMGDKGTPTTAPSPGAPEPLTEEILDEEPLDEEPLDDEDLEDLPLFEDLEDPEGDILEE